MMFIIGLVIGFLVTFFVNLIVWMRSQKAHEKELWTYRFKLLQLMKDAEKFGLQVPALKQYENELIGLIDDEDFEMNFEDNHRERDD